MWWRASARRQPISNSRKADLKSEDLSLEEAMPEAYARADRGSRSGWSSTIATCRTSSSRWSRASSTCCRPATGKRTAQAALKLAVDMCREGLITENEAVLRLDPAQLDQLLHPTIDPGCGARCVREGAAGLARRGRRARSCSIRRKRPSDCRVRQAR